MCRCSVRARSPPSASRRRGRHPGGGQRSNGHRHLRRDPSRARPRHATPRGGARTDPLQRRHRAQREHVVLSILIERTEAVARGLCARPMDEALDEQADSHRRRRGTGGGAHSRAASAVCVRRVDHDRRRDEVHLPYDRPPLSKQVLRSELDDVALKPREFYDENNITLLLGFSVRKRDTANRAVTLDDGTELEYDEVVIANSLVPRRIPSFPDLRGIHVLRSFDESMALREEAGVGSTRGGRRCGIHRLRGGGQPARARGRGRDGGTTTRAAGVGAG